MLTLKITKKVFLENERNFKVGLNKVFFQTVVLQSISEEGDFLHICYSGIGNEEISYSAIKEIFPNDCDVNMYYEY